MLSFLVVDPDPYLKALVAHSGFFFPRHLQKLGRINILAASFLAEEEDQALGGSLAQNHC